MESLQIPMNEAQKLIDKKRLFCNTKLVEEKNAILNGLIELIVYENKPRGVELVYENEDFAILEKPSGVLTHPNGRHCLYSLCDEIWHLWGRKACVAHRLDKETSGLILVAKNKIAQQITKSLFEKKQIYKEYVALVRGKVQKQFSIHKAMALNENYDGHKTRMDINENGKEAFTQFEILENFEDCTLLLCKPFTGRQHQIRLHLFYSKYPIIGEYLYGLDKNQIQKILDKTLTQKERIQMTGANRLCLHSQRLKFWYQGKEFDFVSQKNIKEEFLQARYCETNPLS
ncbi:RNA pseudouridine synthase [Campylobacter sp. MIT 21-1685]|uniref:RluA family pseudouridine synthase n=1 Tax=unclassified Campylobacter TaxID=2593542 RepID=UPI00224B077E|nr:MULTISPECIES: RNA pseudouridine synthase [unclassified Campylobacter]MCX2683462.1 RNA pseudouridine synthase [Campylobacter sp. MIT 21-1684]MCX2751716.1 RNA pseudouridine synthase [Campylobacter sp. MIT 21-1682]MCX2807918.1 RNA pseudouridine synthase [Campylobacter sp. MIT 21-1685]